jgi:hypothetical protein
VEVKGFGSVERGEVLALRESKACLLANAEQRMMSDEKKDRAHKDGRSEDARRSEVYESLRCVEKLDVFIQDGRGEVEEGPVRET